MIAKNLGLVRIGGGVNYNKDEGEDAKYGAMIIAGQKFKVSNKANASFELKYNTRTKGFDGFLKYSQDY